MDILFWGTLGLLALVFIWVILRGIYRLTTSAAPTSNQQEQPSPTIENLGTARLLRDIGKIQGLSSFYDRFWGFLEVLVVDWQLGKITTSWRGFRTNFLRGVNEEIIIPLEGQESASKIMANIADEALREATARHNIEGLDKKEMGETEKTPRDQAQERVKALRTLLKQLEEEAAKLKLQGESETDPDRKEMFKTRYERTMILINDYDMEIFKLRKGFGLL